MALGRSATSAALLAGLSPSVSTPELGLFLGTVQAVASWLVDTIPGGGGGGGGQRPKTLGVPKIDLQVRAPLINFIFFLGKIF